MSSDTSKTSKLAFGRSLGDFGRMTVAEKKLLKCAALGQECIIGEGHPAKKYRKNSIRATLVRFLLLAGDGSAPVHEKGIEIQGAYIEGKLDLDGCRGLLGLVLQDCIVEEPVRAIDANIQILVLINSRLDAYDDDGISIYADRLNVDGDVQITNECHIAGSVYLGGSSVGGVLSFAGSHIATKTCSDDTALFADAFSTKSDVFLSDGFVAKGDVRFIGAELGGSLNCTGGTFMPSATPENPSPLSRNDALSLSHARISEALVLDLTSSGQSRAAKIHGGLVLQGTSVNSLMDSNEIFASENDPAGPAGYVILDGFTYERLLDKAPTDSASREIWLKKQPGDHLKTNFRIQPYQHLARVLRDMGHENDALEIAILKERMRAKSGSMPRVSRIWHSVLGFLVSYGYRPWRVAYFALIMWIAGAAVFEVGWRAGDIVPSQSVVALRDEYRKCREISHPSTGEILPLSQRIELHDDVLDCLNGLADVQLADDQQSVPSPAVPKDLREYPGFHSVVYSLDVLLPIMDFAQEQYWRPSALTDYGQALRVVQWLFKAIGWFLTAIGAAAISGFVRND